MASLRQAIFSRTRLREGHIPENLETLVWAISERPSTVSDDDLDHLRGEGYSEDQIYELILAAAVGAGMRRMDAGLRAIERAG